MVVRDKHTSNVGAPNGMNLKSSKSYQSLAEPAIVELKDLSIAVHSESDEHELIKSDFELGFIHWSLFAQVSHIRTAFRADLV